MADTKAKMPIPQEVKEIFAEINKIQYEKLCEAGWCVSCYRKPAGLGVRCPECQANYTKRQEKYARDKGCMPWKAGKPGRPPKK